MKFKKILTGAFPFLLVLSANALSGCAEVYDDYLVIYNWEDYIYEGTDEDGNEIDDGTIKQFEKYYQEKTGRTIKVDYETFSTNEIMYQQIKLGAIQPDLICPSDYMIQKMANAGLLEEFSYSEETGKYEESLKNWDTYSSPYIRERFSKEKLNNGKSYLTYSVPYFWGTMGFTYDADDYDMYEMNTWEILWSNNEKFQKQITIKDSMRDSYVPAIFHVYHDEIAALNFEAEDYNEQLSAIFNRHDDQTLALVKDALIQAKRTTVYGFEVDEGKEGIVRGDYNANFAWSGDSIFSMDEAEKAGKTLNYALPSEGSNVWFDGWCMPKGAQKELAEEFVNFICKPSVAVECMSEVGYTSPVVGDEVWEYVTETYASKDENEETYPVDLGFFFGGDDKVINIPMEEKGRQFDAQYPSLDVLKRCCMMKDFGADTDKVDAMWQQVKAAN